MTRRLVFVVFERLFVCLFIGCENKDGRKGLLVCCLDGCLDGWMDGWMDGFVCLFV